MASPSNAERPNLELVPPEEDESTNSAQFTYPPEWDKDVYFRERVSAVLRVAAGTGEAKLAELRGTRPGPYELRTAQINGEDYDFVIHYGR